MRQEAPCSMQSTHCMHKCHESCKLGTELMAVILQQTCDSLTGICQRMFLDLTERTPVHRTAVWYNV